MNTVSKWGRHRISLLLATIFLVGCSSSPDNTAQANVTAPPAAAPTISAGRLAAAERAIAAESKVRAVSYSAPRWRVSVDDDGSRREGYAQYLCLTLGEQGARDDRTEIEIVDQAQPSRQLAFLRCSTAA